MLKQEQLVTVQHGTVWSTSIWTGTDRRLFMFLSIVQLVCPNTFGAVIVMRCVRLVFWDICRSRKKPGWHHI